MSSFTGRDEKSGQTIQQTVSVNVEDKEKQVEIAEATNDDAVTQKNPRRNWRIKRNEFELATR